MSKMTVALTAMLAGVAYRRTLLVLLLATAPWLPAFGATRYDGNACVFSDRDWFDPERMRCGSLIVELPGISTIFRLPVLRIAGGKGVPRRPPVVFLNGGPGGRGVTEVGGWLQHPLLRDRDLILFDGRATGRAEPTLCPGLERHVMDALMADLDQVAEVRMRANAVDACLRGSGIHWKSRVVSTAASVDDIESIRREFGDEQLVLYGVSYGTRTAVAYANAHPQRVAAMILDSPIPPGSSYYADIPATFDGALAAVFAACRADPACDRRYPALADRYAKLIERLKKDPLHLRMPASHARPAGLMVLNARDLRLLLHQLLYGREFFPVVPALIDRLTRDEIDTLPLWYELGIEMRVQGLSFPAYYLTLAAEESAGNMPADAELAVFDTDAAVLGRLRGTDASAGAPAISTAGVTSPTLLFSGLLDPIAAPAYARDIASTMPAARLAIFADVGHAVSMSMPCAGDMIAGFLRDPATASDCGAVRVPPRFAVGHRDFDGLALLAQRVMLPRSMMPLAPLGYVLAALSALAAVFLGRVLILLAASFRHSEKRDSVGPLSATTGWGAFFCALVLSVWVGVLAAVMNGPHPVALLVGIPEMAVWPLRISTVLVCVVTVWMLMRIRCEWRGQRLIRRMTFAMSLTANLVLLAFLTGYGLAWV